MCDGETMVGGGVMVRGCVTMVMCAFYSVEWIAKGGWCIELRLCVKGGKASHHFVAVVVPVHELAIEIQFRDFHERKSGNRRGGELLARHVNLSHRSTNQSTN